MEKYRLLFPNSYKRQDVGSNNTKNEQKMRKLILIFSIFILSGCSKSVEIERIEIMSYYYNLNENQTKFKTELVTYSTIDEDGNVETMQKNSFSKKEYLNFKSNVDRNLIDKISINNRNKNDEFYNEKPKNQTVKISCEPIIRIKIKYNNLKEITFNYSENETNPKLTDFMVLRNGIRNSYAENKFVEIENTKELEKKQKDFEKYSLNKDTLKFPFPPMPKKSTVKFTK